MNRIDRLVAIQTFLQSRRLVTANRIAERFDISLRTVYRDIRALEESGVPIIGEAGVGYSIESGYRLPPIMFTREEATAMITAGKMVGTFADISIDSHFVTALEKVKAVIRHSDKEFLENLEDNIMVFNHFGTETSSPNCFMFNIQQAISSNVVVTLEYESGSKGEITRREVEPAGICFYSGRWHLFAYCLLRGDYRDFRLDRIRQLSLTDRTYSRQHPPVDELLLRMLDNPNNQKVTLLFQPHKLQELAQQKYYYGMVKEIVTDDGILMTFMTDSLEWMVRWILILGAGVKIVEPQALDDMVRNRVKELTETYK